MNFKEPRSYSLDTLPKKYKFNIERCKFINSNYDIKIWSGGECYDLIKNKYPNYLRLYESLPHPTSKCDMARYVILYEYGGIYSDCDRICQKPYDDLIDTKTDVYLASLPYKIFWLINPDILITKPRSHLMFLCFSTIKVIRSGNELYNISNTASAGHLTKVYKKYKGSEKIKVITTQLQPCTIFGCSTDITEAYSYADVMSMSWMGTKDGFLCRTLFPNFVYVIIIILVVIIIILISLRLLK